MDASESLSMILKWFYFVSAFPVLFNMYRDKDSNLISEGWQFEITPSEFLLIVNS